MKAEIWPYARHKMTPEELAEVRAYGREHRVDIRMGWSVHTRRFFAYVGTSGAQHPDSPIEAFRRACNGDQPIVSLVAS